MIEPLPPIHARPDETAVRDLLAAAGLPVAGLSTAHLDDFWSCDAGEDLASVVRARQRFLHFGATRLWLSCQFRKTKVLSNRLSRLTVSLLPGPQIALFARQGADVCGLLHLSYL